VLPIKAIIKEINNRIFAGMMSRDVESLKIFIQIETSKESQAIILNPPLR
jgi:mRNA degradation ribonuclease J1/J2